MILKNRNHHQMRLVVYLSFCLLYFGKKSPSKVGSSLVRAGPESDQWNRWAKVKTDIKQGFYSRLVFKELLLHQCAFCKLYPPKYNHSEDTLKVHRGYIEDGNSMGYLHLKYSNQVSIVIYI